MKRHARKAFTALKNAGCPVKEWDDDSRGHFWIDTEDPEAETWLDYWCIDLISGSGQLNNILSSNGLHFEWQDSAVASVYDI